MKFFKGNLERITNIEVFPMISLLLFVTFFLGVIIYVLTKKKGAYEKTRHLPLDEKDESL